MKKILNEYKEQINKSIVVYENFTKEELVTRRKDITLKEFFHKLKTHKKVRQIFRACKPR